MLTALSISNIVLIERLDLDFEGGLDVLTQAKPAPASRSCSTRWGLHWARAPTRRWCGKGSDQAQVTASFAPPAAGTPLAAARRQ